MYPVVLQGDEAQVEGRFGLFGDSANLDTTQVHGFCAEHTKGQKLFWTHLMELLGDVALVESHFSPFGDRVSVGARYMHGLHQMYHRLRNRFGHTQWYFMVMRLKWKLDSVYLEIVLILAQDKCTYHRLRNRFGRT